VGVIIPYFQRDLFFLVIDVTTPAIQTIGMCLSDLYLYFKANSTDLVDLNFKLKADYLNYPCQAKIEMKYRKCGGLKLTDCGYIPSNSEEDDLTCDVDCMYTECIINSEETNNEDLKIQRLCLPNSLTQDELFNRCSSHYGKI
jgi:hypothetical protein